jgi:hypothetical protein
MSAAMSDQLQIELNDIRLKIMRMEVELTEQMRKLRWTLFLMIMFGFLITVILNFELMAALKK